MLHLKKKQNILCDLPDECLVWWRGRAKLLYGVPVERDSRGIGLWEVIHQRRPAASRWRKGERLWPVVIHHFQTPVCIKWHGVTWGEDGITRDVGRKDFEVVLVKWSLYLLFSSS